MAIFVYIKLDFNVKKLLTYFEVSDVFLQSIFILKNKNSISVTSDVIGIDAFCAQHVHQKQFASAVRRRGNSTRRAGIFHAGSPAHSAALGLLCHKEGIFHGSMSNFRRRTNGPADYIDFGNTAAAAADDGNVIIKSTGCAHCEQ